MTEIKLGFDLAGPDLPGALMNVRQAATRYVYVQRTRGRFGRGTANSVDCTLMQFAEASGNPKIGSLKPRHLDRWFARRTDVQPNTRRRQFSQINAFCAFAVKERWLKANPCAGIDPPKAPRSQPRSLPATDVRQVLNAAEDAREELMILLAVQEGLRCCEIARLERADINFGERIIRVVGKGGHERFVPLSDQTARAAERYATEVDARNGTLIRSRLDRGVGITPERVSHVIGEAFARSGIKRANGDGRSAHALRHTAASDVCEASGGDVRLVQEFLGHFSLQTTSRYLQRHQALGKLREAAAGRHY